MTIRNARSSTSTIRACRSTISTSSSSPAASPSTIGRRATRPASSRRPERSTSRSGARRSRPRPSRVTSGTASRRASMSPAGARTRIVCISRRAEVFIAGARFDETARALRRARRRHRRACNTAPTTPRRIARSSISSARSIVTGSAGCWSPNCSRSARAAGPAFRPHKHDDGPPADRDAARRDLQFPLPPGPWLRTATGAARGRRDGRGLSHRRRFDLVILDKGYHPCVAAPGYEMYYFTILGGLSQRPLMQFFQPDARLSDRDDTRHQGHDREVQMTIARSCAVLGAGRRWTVCRGAGLVVLGWEDAVAYRRGGGGERVCPSSCRPVPAADDIRRRGCSARCSAPCRRGAGSRRLPHRPCHDT